MSDRDKPVVLLVDDNDATCTLIAAILRPHFSVEVASDGNEAIERIRTRKYAALLLDLLMPRRDGYEVLEFIKQDNPALLKRVLVVTAALTENELRRARAYGVCDIIRKPFEVDHLLSAVQACVATPEKGIDVFCSTPILLLLADLLRQRLM